MFLFSSEHGGSNYLSAIIVEPVNGCYVDVIKKTVDCNNTVCK